MILSKYKIKKTFRSEGLFYASLTQREAVLEMTDEVTCGALEPHTISLCSYLRYANRTESVAKATPIMSEIGSIYPSLMMCAALA